MGRLISADECSEMFARVWIGSVVCLLTSGLAHAQHWKFQTYGAADGLTNPNIMALHQDRQGFLWAATEGGLFRYDGDRFKAFELGGAPNATTVLSLYTSIDGQLWAGSTAGLFRWSGDRFVRIPQSAGLELQSGQAIGSDAAHLYLAAASGLWSLPLSKTGTLTQVTSVTANSVFVSRDNTVWFGCGTGLCALRDLRPYHWNGSGNLPAGPWNSIAEDPNGHLWLRSADRVMVRESANGTFHEVGKLASTHRAVLVPAGRGEVLVPHTEGLAICQVQGCRDYGVESGLEHAQVLAVTNDREGSLWLGYSGHGLARWLGRDEWQSFSEAEGLSDSQIWRIVRDRAGDLWVGTNRGLFQGSEKHGRWRFRRIGVMRNWTVYGLLADPDGSLWLGTFQTGLNGLVHFDPRSGKQTVYKPAKPLRDFAISGLSRDAAGAIWVATPKGVLRLNVGSQRLEEVELPVSGASIYQINHVAGALYVSGRKGLYVERGGVRRLLTVADGLKDNSIQSVAVGPKGEVWIAYYEALGLTRLDWNGGKIKLRHFTVGEGLPSAVVYSQFFDAHGRHWIGTDSGVAMFDGHRWNQYDTLDGLVWNDCNAGSYLAEPDGAVWIGTSDGMSRFVSLEHQAAQIPLTLVTAVMRNDMPVISDVFDAATHSVALRYTMLSYRRANLRFRYRLGEDSPWIETRMHEAHFAELPPGAYRFEVQGEIAPGIWSYSGTKEFRIRPPWFRSQPVVVGGPFVMVILIWLGWRRREQVQARIRADLEAAVTERTRSLAAATARAEQESRFKGEFLANMSHEMRTPLNGILGITKLALELSNEPEVVRHLTTVQFSAKLLLSLINDVLDLAKMEAGMVKIVPLAFAPRVLCEEVRSMLDTEARSKGLRLELRFDNALPEWLWGDDSRIRQVLINLVGNAIKFTHQGNVTVSLNHDGSHLHCTVADTGIGIAAAEQEKIFEVFRQADGSTSRRYGGSGLGLAISRKIVESIGGTICVESTVGVGSTFSFNVPAPETKAPETSHAPGQKAEIEPVRAMRILVAEDNKVNQYLLTALLRKWGHSFKVANNGREALAAFAKEQFDLVLMDIQMPEMDGIEAVQLIRQAEAETGKRVPVIAVTARAMPGDQAEIVAAGMDDYLEKPIQTERLEAILRRVSGTCDSDKESLSDCAHLQVAPTL